MKFREWLAFILLGLIWGSSFLWIKIAIDEIGPFLLVTLRISLGILALLLVAAIARPPWPREPTTWAALTLLGLINNALPYLLISWGEIYIDSAIAAILNSTAPLFTMIIAHFFLYDDRMTASKMLALLVGFSGIVILFSRDGGIEFGGGLAGKMAVLLAAILYAISSVYARRVTKGLAPTIQAMVPLLGANIMLWGITPIIEAPLTFPSLLKTWLAIVWLGVMGIALAYLLYFYLLHAVGPTRTVLVTYIFPLVGVVLGVVFLQERLDWQLVTGAMLVIGSIIIVNRKQ